MLAALKSIRFDQPAKETETSNVNKHPTNAAVNLHYTSCAKMIGLAIMPSTCLSERVYFPH